ncbi:hypothetical protein PLICRDRAFT_91487 [Plicaturopsis crispa FD-325 SS-3]|nr:hypothetical protein PLICRDRAFT_91487 [Plicaturopsis crispa FD-325 SS-3]
MGNSASSSGRGQQDATVDFGQLTPQGVYTGPRDWNHSIVTQLIIDRKLAPFYRPLEDYDDSWDDERILAARKESPDAEGTHSDASSIRTGESQGSSSLKAGHHHGHHKRTSLRDTRFPDASIYRGAVECPICFLYYPPNINHSRCCDQAICTECFVQIKRAEPTTTHLVSEPAACPYCVQDNFGVVYTPPPWRAGIGSEGSTPPWSEGSSPRGSPSPVDAHPVMPTHKRRQKSFGYDSPEVVTTDQIRPDWEAKLAAVRAQVTRRANRRIIMRQVGDRLIPIGVTSGRIHALPTEDGQLGEGGGEGGSGRRSRRRQQNQDLNQYLGSMGLGGQDLEELMVMEAMRLSMIEQEEQQKKEAERKKNNPDAADGDAQGEASAAQATAEGAANGDASSGAAPSTAPRSATPVLAPADLPAPHLSAPAEAVSSNTASTPGTPRSRTPVPTDEEGTQHPSNVPPFSTISAALSTTSTASAILKSSESTALPTSAPLAAPSSEASNSNAGTEGRSTPVHAESQTSSVASEGGSTYDVLPSTPGSTVSHEPLLEGARTDQGLTPESSRTSDLG